MVNNFAELEQKLKNSTTKSVLALCCSQDKHSLEAVAKARRGGLIEAVLIGDVAKTKEILAKIGESASDYKFVEQDGAENVVATAASMVNEGTVNLIMKGKIQTSDLMRNVLKKENNLRKSSVISVCGLLELEKYPNGSKRRFIVNTDPAINVHPSLAQKKAILENAVGLMHALGNECPKVACIAANEQVSPKILETVEANELKEMYLRGEITGCVVDGPLSLDLAMSPESASIKGMNSPVAGAADILMMPDLVSSNVFAKFATVLSNCLDAGVVLGAKIPMVLTSRAAEASNKYYSIALAAYVAKYGNREDIR